MEEGTTDVDGACDTSGKGARRERRQVDHPRPADEISGGRVGTVVAH